jgi:hypothetical protein
VSSDAIDIEIPLPAKEILMWVEGFVFMSVI